MRDYLTDYNPGDSNVKVELDLKNYGTKVDISSFALKTNLQSVTKIIETHYIFIKKSTKRQ